MDRIDEARMRFQKFGFITLLAVYFLILVGGIVRSTGSGMGCPDWPKCFGRWVPPTDKAQLPQDYLEVYKQKRIVKNEKLAVTLRKIGFTAVADTIVSHPAAFIETDFNPTKTWIEYLNRVAGASIGILIFLTLLFAFPLRKTDKRIFTLSLLAFIVVGFQGWLGSIVVSTNLLPEIVTVHMALALVLIALLIYVLVLNEGYRFPVNITPISKKILVATLILTLITFIQIILGTQVREAVDRVAFNFDYQLREQWVDQIGVVFKQHRIFSVLILALNVLVSIKLLELKNSRISRIVWLMLSVIGLEIVAGLWLAMGSLPPFLQPIHLLLGTLLFGVQFYIFILYFCAGKRNVKQPVTALNS